MIIANKELSLGNPNTRDRRRSETTGKNDKLTHTTLAEQQKTENNPWATNREKTTEILSQKQHESVTNGRGTQNHPSQAIYPRK